MKERIEKKLNDAFAPSKLIVVNQSHLHQGHAGDDGSGESHFSLEISAVFFNDLSRLERQRAVFAALEEEMQDVHALTVHVCPEEK